MQRQYNKVAEVNILIDKIRRHFEKSGYDSKLVSGNIIEIEKTSTPRKLTGLSTGLRIAVTVKRDQTIIDISGHVEEYLLKGAAALPWLILAAPLAPLAAPAAYGVYQQYKLVKELEQEIDDYFNDLIIT
jgi:hypothetical protein